MSRDAATQAIRGYRAAGGTSELAPPSRVRLARALAVTGDWPRSFEALRDVEPQSDPSIPALRAEATAHAQTVQAARATYAQAARQLSSADRSAVIATALDALGHHQLASQMARVALILRPDATQLWMVAGLAESQMGRLSEFIAEGVPAAAAANPAAGWTAFATFLTRSGQSGTAERVLRDALGLDEYDTCMRIAAVATEARRPSVAASYLRRAAAIESQNPEPWLHLAELAIGVQQQEAAREAIANAQQRGADAEMLNALRTRAGIPETDAQGLRRTTIR
jgi:tetratricopeptide (TPR) repeat protein